MLPSGILWSWKHISEDNLSFSIKCSVSYEKCHVFKGHVKVQKV